MVTHMGFINSDGSISFEDEDESECCIFVNKNSSSHTVLDTALLGWTKESATQAFIENRLDYDEYHRILQGLLEEDAANDGSKVKISYVDTSDTVTNSYEGFLF